MTCLAIILATLGALCLAGLVLAWLALRKLERCIGEWL